MPAAIGLRLRRAGDALTVEYNPGGLLEQGWVMHRLAYLPAALPVSVGPMAASPQGGGFAVRFRGLRVERDAEPAGQRRS